ncbi:hypothetical protein TGDOM2_357990 [Toxoplasma gondii GAB2-2007-GAL-DOM2]|uniref:Uncharacterized protein n=2 Tax=Toxoplasma gondii TaxID=5811 RepID=A0A086KP99_TOXGO|nr:hypothetical protein TGDOM2_357990 [Toxoplasma gondii GAB2-2007-GAL-DOM2]KFG46217.1 hypothetical protein TGFOU_357990 [Toxoplasma gondii FOU]
MPALDFFCCSLSSTGFERGGCRLVSPTDGCGVRLAWRRRCGRLNTGRIDLRVHFSLDLVERFARRGATAVVRFPALLVGDFSAKAGYRRRFRPSGIRRRSGRNACFIVSLAAKCPTATGVPLAPRPRRRVTRLSCRSMMWRVLRGKRMRQCRGKRSVGLLVAASRWQRRNWSRGIGASSKAAEEVEARFHRVT